MKTLRLLDMLRLLAERNAGREAARREAARWRKGAISITEAITSAGLNAVYIAAVLIAASVVLFFIARSSLGADLRTVVSTVQQQFAASRNYGAVDNDFLIDSGQLPDAMVDAGTGTIVIGDYESAVGPGVTGSPMAANNRRFVVHIGTTATPIDDLEICRELVMGAWPRLHTVGVVAAVATAGTAPDLVPGTIACTATTCWGPGTFTGAPRLDQRNEATANTACAPAAAAPGASVFLSFR